MSEGGGVFEHLKGPPPPSSDFDASRNVEKCRKMSSFGSFVEVAAAAPPAATSTHHQEVEKYREMSLDVEFCRILVGVVSTNFLQIVIPI